MEKFVGDTYVRLPKMRKGFLLYMTVRMIKSVLSVESCKIYDGQEWQQHICLNGWPLFSPEM